MIALCKRLAASALFLGAIVGVIILNAVILGLETAPRVCWATIGSPRLASP